MSEHHRLGYICFISYPQEPATATILESCEVNPTIQTLTGLFGQPVTASSLILSRASAHSNYPSKNQNAGSLCPTNILIRSRLTTDAYV